MIKAGITGGIGSGKTTVCKIFEVLGVPVYYADDRAKELINTDPILIEKIKKLFGDDIYDAENNIHKKKVASIVFNFPEILKQYNDIIHPLVIKDSEKWMRRHTKYNYVLKEAALLFESGTYKKLDTIICVTAPEQIRIQRIMERDGVSEPEVFDRIRNQMPEKDKIAKSEFIIYNDGSTPLIPQVLNIHEKLSEKSNK